MSVATLVKGENVNGQPNVVHMSEPENKDVIAKKAKESDAKKFVLSTKN